MAVAAGHSRDEIAQPLETLSAQLGANGFARIASWSLAHRRQLLAELESLRRLAFLMSELDDYLSRVPGPKSAPPPLAVLREAQTPAN